MLPSSDAAILEETFEAGSAGYGSIRYAACRDAMQIRKFKRVLLFPTLLLSCAPMDLSDGARIPVSEQVVLVVDYGIRELEIDNKFVRRGPFVLAAGVHTFSFLATKALPKADGGRHIRIQTRRTCNGRVFLEPGERYQLSNEIFPTKDPKLGANVKIHGHLYNQVVDLKREMSNDAPQKFECSPSKIHFPLRQS